MSLTQIPAPLPLYLKAAASGRRKPAPDVSIPPLETGLASLRADAKLLAAYNAVCGFTPGETLPITYPQVMATPLHMHLMNQPGFPLPLLGLVHLRNHIRQTRPLRADEDYRVRVATGESRQGRAGLEFDLLTEFFSGEERVYEATTTVLYRNVKPSGNKPKPPAPEANLAEYRSFDAPADIGRRYARIGKDYNPIHLYAFTAKMLGFPRAIAHGMWSLARCAALLESELGAPARELSVQFKQPLLLPGKVAVRYRSEGDSLAFSLLSRSADKVHLSGSLR